MISCEFIYLLKRESMDIAITFRFNFLPPLRHQLLPVVLLVTEPQTHRHVAALVPHALFKQKNMKRIKASTKKENRGGSVENDLPMKKRIAFHTHSHLGKSGKGDRLRLHDHARLVEVDLDGNLICGRKCKKKA